MVARYAEQVLKQLNGPIPPRGEKADIIEARAQMSGGIVGDSLSLAGPGMALDYALWLIRWVTITGLLLLSIAQPLIGRIGLPTWTLITVFACYSVAVGLLRQRIAWLRPYSRIALIDLVVVAALYAIAASPGGPVFVLFLLLTVCATSTTTLLRGPLYNSVRPHHYDRGVSDASAVGA